MWEETSQHNHYNIFQAVRKTSKNIQGTSCLWKYSRQKRLPRPVNIKLTGTHFPGPAYISPSTCRKLAWTIQNLNFWRLVYYEPAHLSVSISLRTPKKISTVAAHCNSKIDVFFFSFPDSYEYIPGAFPAPLYELAIDRSQRELCNSNGLGTT
jgi:hypothetical protein